MSRPPFTISAKAVNLIAEIAGRLGRRAERADRTESLRLRKANRIRTICASLAIEGNTLTESQVSAVFEGRRVVAPPRQILEVRNAIRAYELFPTLDPFSADDLLKAHGVMMEALTDDAGAFRRGNVGVFAGTRAVHVAPPADRVPFLVEDLFRWLRTSVDHLLVRSCVFHYELEFIHPFSDGNGRMGRLWQSLILGLLDPVFEQLPVENLVYARQSDYYDAINRSTEGSDSGPFIDFMLGEIAAALNAGEFRPSVVSESAAEYAANVGANVGENVGATERHVLAILAADKYATAKKIAAELGKTQRQAERVLKKLREKELIRRIGPDKTGFWEVRGNAARTF